MLNFSTAMSGQCLVVAASMPAGRSTVRLCDPPAGADSPWAAASAPEAVDANAAVLDGLKPGAAAGAPDQKPDSLGRTRRASGELRDAPAEPATLPGSTPAWMAQSAPVAGRLQLLPQKSPPFTCTPPAPGSAEALQAETDSLMVVRFLKRSREMTTLLGRLAVRDVVASELPDLAPNLRRMAGAVKDVDMAYARSATPFGLKRADALALRDVLHKAGFDTLYAASAIWRNEDIPGAVARNWAAAREAGDRRDYDAWFATTFAPGLRSMANQIIALQDKVCAAILCGKDELLRMVNSVPPPAAVTPPPAAPSLR